MDASYAEIGTWVILGRHKREDRYRGLSWYPDMEKYVGKKTIIKEVYLVTGIMFCIVACDRGRFSWRAEDMILATDVPLLTSKQRWELKIRGY